MRYLKKYNENINKISELNEFCSNYLVDLIDLNCRIDIEFFHINNYTFYLRVDEALHWKDIKYSFVPFLHMLNKNYKIVSRIEIGDYKNLYAFTVDELLNDYKYFGKIKIIKLHIEVK